MCKTGKHLLIIEDMSSVALFLKLTLEQDGYIVETANTAKKAIELLNRSKGRMGFDLILCDLHLPDASGPDMLHQLSETAECPPKIVISADDNPQTRRQAFAAGADEYIEKPFTVDQVKKLIEKCCATRHKLRHHGQAAINFNQAEESLYADYYKYLDGLAQQLSSPMSFDQLQSLIHQLKGSAALYGLETLSRIAKQLEITLKDHGHSATSQVRKKLQKYLTEEQHEPA